MSKQYEIRSGTASLPTKAGTTPPDWQSHGYEPILDIAEYCAVRGPTWAGVDAWLKQICGDARPLIDPAETVGRWQFHS